MFSLTVFNGIRFDSYGRIDEFLIADLDCWPVGLIGRLV